jgi:uncharacterized membrane-anchored protein
MSFSHAGRSGLVKVPEISLAFWAIKLLSTAMGEASSDFLIRLLTPFPAVGLGFIVFSLSLFLQFRAKAYNAWTYWFAVVMVSVFGTMAADIAHVGLGIPYEVSTIGFAAALVVIFVVWKRTEGTLSIHSINARRREVFYWLTVLTTFALGTAAGDWTAHSLGWGFLVSAVVFTVIMFIPAIGFRWMRFNAVFAFWFAYIVTRPVGASFADWIGAEPSRGGLGFGFGNIALALTAVILLLVWREQQRPKTKNTMAI